MLVRRGDFRVRVWREGDRTPPRGAPATRVRRDLTTLLTWGAAPDQAPRNRKQHLCPKLSFDV